MRTNDIHIRPYTPADYVSVRRNMEEGGLYYPEMDAEPKLNEKIQRNPCSILVAEVHGDAVGNVLIMEDGWGPFFFRLAVAKEYRGKGIGSLLLHHLEGMLAGRGYREVYCLVNDNDTMVKEYYKKRGFEEGEKAYRVMCKGIERR